MENLSLIKIRVTRKSNGQPASGYFIDLWEVTNDNEEKVTDSEGYVKPFSMDMNNFIYADITVRDPDDNIVAQANGQYPLTIPETIINIEV